MQTFLPYASFAATAAVLDDKRLGKQRVETLQVLQTLLRERLITSDQVTTKFALKTRTKSVPRAQIDWVREPVVTQGWVHHPAVLMWKGYELSLLEYQEATCAEWVARGNKDTCLIKSQVLLEPYMDTLNKSTPEFINDCDVHRSHKSNLIRKDEAFYGAIWKGIPNDLPYKWPVSHV